MNHSVKPLIIGIAGGSGSGKTSVTKRMLELLDTTRVSVIPHDAYYYDTGIIPDAEINFDHPDSLETSLLISHVKQLRGGKAVSIPVYDFSTYRRRSEQLPMEATDIIILEGILIFVSKELRDLMDIRIFIDTDPDERVVRRIQRDTKERGRSVESVIEQYMGTVRPMHLEFVEPSKRWADIIIPRGVENSVAIDMVVTKIRSLLEVRELERR